LSKFAARKTVSTIMFAKIITENQCFTCPKLSAREKRKKYNSGL